MADGGDRYLRDPSVNKGTAYTRDERVRLKIDGLLPPRAESLPEQAARVIENMRDKPELLERYRYLRAVQDENETLFYRVVLDHLEETLPIIYTPTVGQACLDWSRIYERPRGLYISAAQHRGRVAEVLEQWRTSVSASSWSPTAAESSVSATLAQTAWAFPSASSRSTPRAPECHQRSACQ